MRSDSYSSNFYSSYEEETWEQRFCQQQQFNQLLIKVPTQFFKEQQLLYGLEDEVQYFHQALELILYNEVPDSDTIDAELLDQEAQILYALVHQKYVSSSQGLHEIKKHYLSGHYGQCPNIKCEGQNLLPFGGSAQSGKSVMQCYCCKCENLYKMYEENQFFHIDGCFFGPEFPTIFLLSYPQFLPANNLNANIDQKAFQQQNKQQTQESYKMILKNK